MSHSHPRHLVISRRTPRWAQHLAALLVLSSMWIVLFTAVPAGAAPPSPLWQEAGAAFQKGDWKAAARAYEAITKQEPGSGRAWYRLATSYAKLGRLKDAVPAYLKAEVIGQSPVVRYDLACVYTKLADSTEAFAWLEKAVASGFRSVSQIKGDPDLEPLRGSTHFASIVQRVEWNERPCAHLPEHRQFDFWVGEWNVATPEGNKAGESSIVIENGDCWVHENWRSAIAGTGQSFNYYNPTTKTWHQTWVDDQGEIAEFDGTLRDGAMRLEGYRQGPNGSRIPARLTLTPLPGGTVRQLGENSTDNGATWTVLYDLVYTRKAAAASGSGAAQSKTE